jgi:hypothetical protein
VREIAAKAAVNFSHQFTARLKPRSFKGASRQSAADEVDDFEAVAVFERDLGPAVAGGNIAIELDGDAVGLHVEGFNQGGKCEFGGGHGVREGALFSVDVKVHYGNFILKSHRFTLTGGLGPIQNRSDDLGFRSMRCGKQNFNAEVAETVRAEKPARLFAFAEGELAGYGAAFVIGLNDDGRIGQGGFIDLDGDFGAAGGTRDGLRIKRCGVGAGKAESEAGVGNGGAAFRDAQLHVQISIRMNRGSVLPLDVQLFDGGQGFGFGVIENAVELPFADGFEDEAVLVAKLLLFLRVAEVDFLGRSRVGNRLLADALSAHEDLRLKQFFALARFALHVIDGVAVFDVGIEAENHKRFVIE